MKHKLTYWKIKLLAKLPPLRVIVGAGGIGSSRWISTDIRHLNIAREVDWGKYFYENSIDAILAEHVWEHLTQEEAYAAAQNCFKYLKFNGYLRVAVPDGFHPSYAYRESVKPGGFGSGAEDHKILYNYKTLSEAFKVIGFEVELLEYFDETGRFIRKEWDPQDGLIVRSSKYDERNKVDKLIFTSIILDARKRCKHSKSEKST